MSKVEQGSVITLHKAAPPGNSLLPFSVATLNTVGENSVGV